MSVVIGLVAEGDSLTYAGNSGQGPGYVYAAAGITDYTTIPGTSISALAETRTSWRFTLSGCIAVNVAVAGSRLSTNAISGSWPGDLTQRAATRVDALINSGYPGSKAATGIANNRAARKYIFTCMIGTNPDSSDYTAQAATYKSYLQGRVAAGYTGLVIGTILSRNDGILADFETYRQGWNSIIRAPSWLASLGAKVAVCADFGAEPTIGAAGACNNATLFSDTVHPTPTGYTYMTPLYLAAVNQVKAAI